MVIPGFRSGRYFSSESLVNCFGSPQASHVCGNSKTPHIAYSRPKTVEPMCDRVSQARPTKLVKANLDKSRSKHIGSLVAEHIECTFCLDSGGNLVADSLQTVR